MLSLIFGAIVGLSLGLTGGGGAILAVPLLIYGLSVDPRQAVGISLAAVSVTSLVGFVGRWMLDEVEVATGLVFAVAGMLGAPIGSWLHGRIPESLLLMSFALLMLVVAVRMWLKAGSTNSPPLLATNVADGPACRQGAGGKLGLTSPYAVPLGIAGLLTGVLAGLFGVGGGFVIVPAMVLYGGMAIQRAVGTSLLVIALVSASGVASHLLAGREIPLDTALYFVVGGTLGMFAGTWASRYLSESMLQKIFAVVIVAVAIFVIFRTTLYHQS
jgi:uncharacterized membrane protein YfcA